MAKKKRHRIWWYPLFAEEYKQFIKTRQLGEVHEDGDEYAMLFDSQTTAYSMACANRFVVKRENGEVIKDENGLAQIENHGRIYMIGVKGKTINWKKASALKVPDDVDGEVIALEEVVKLDRQNIYQIIEENDEAFEKYGKAPFKPQGGVVVDKGTIATEDVQPTTES